MQKTIEQIETELQGDPRFKNRKVLKAVESQLKPGTLIVTFVDGSQTNLKA